MNPAKFSNHKLWIAPALLVLIVLALFSTAGATQSQLAAELLLEPAIDMPTVESEHPYANNFDDFWTIEMIGAEATRIHFSRIELEENADYLIISDPSEKRTQVITGSYPDGLWTDPVPGSYVRVRLITDVNVRKWGFAIDQKEAVAYPSLLRSAHPYHNNTDETWTVLNDDPTPGEATHIHFSKIDLEENVDWLILSDIDGNPYQYITGSHPGGLWSNGIPGIAVRVQLIADSNVEKWGFNIDSAESSTVSQPHEKPALPTLLESNHPYGDNVDQTWTLVNPDPTAKSTKIHFSGIQTEECCDWVYILDANDTLIQLLSGSHTDLWSDYVPGRIVKIRFRSNRCCVRGWGFRIDDIASSVEKPGLAQSNHTYGDGVDQTWTLVNPDPTAKSTKIHFSGIQTEECCDWVYILDANDTLIQLLSGSHTDLWSDYVPGRIVKIRFRSNRCCVRGWGFRIDDIASSVEKPGLAQSHHPYSDNVDQTWTLVNPNGNANFTRVHFDYLNTESCCDYVRLLDANGTVIQTLSGTRSDFWSDDIPGRIVQVRFTSNRCCVRGWGFRIDDIYPANEDPITPAAINGVYVQVNHPGHIFLNDAEVAYAQEPGEYKILLPGIGEHHIRIEYMEYIQDILVTITERGGIHVIYLPVQEKE